MVNQSIKFDELSNSAIVRINFVRQLFNISAPTVWRWSKSGYLPKPIRIGGITGWQVGELRATMRALSQARDKP